MTQKIALRSFELITNDFELWDYIEKLAVSEYRASLEKEIEKRKASNHLATQSDYNPEAMGMEKEDDSVLALLKERSGN